MAKPTEARQRAILARLDKFSRFTGSSIGIPFTRFKIGAEAVIGLVPVVGDAFDAIYKANTRNTRLLRSYLEKQLSVEPTAPPFPWKILIGLSILFGAITAGLMLIF
jgi:hypothetical protein